MTTARFRTSLFAATAAVAAIALAGTAQAYTAPKVTQEQWTAAKNTWKAQAAARGVPVTCTTMRDPHGLSCTFGENRDHGRVTLAATSTRCVLAAIAYKPLGSPAPRWLTRTVNGCKPGWVRSLPVPWRVG